VTRIVTPGTLHWSELKVMGQSAQHYAYRIEHPEEETLALRLGVALDALVFESQDVVAYEGTSRQNKGWVPFVEANAGAVCLTKPEAERVYGMRDALLRRSDAWNLIRDCGAQQQVLRWSVSGRLCEGTPDAFDIRRKVDLKVTRCANPRQFKWDAKRLGYLGQAAWYRNALTVAKCYEPREEYIVAVENLAPYPIVVYRLTDRALAFGERQWRSLFEELRVCEDSAHWPGYCDTIAELDVPGEDDEPTTLLIGGEEVEV
jgi:hypothetical protein